MELYRDIEIQMKQAVDHLHEEMKQLRTGRASLAILDGLTVDYYGTPTPLNQMASVSVPEPRMLLVKPWDKSTIQLIEKAIATSALNLNPQNDGEIIRIPIPMLTEERRKEITKVVREYGEKCKIAIRAARHDAKGILETLKKEGEVSEDDQKAAMKKVEATVQEGNGVTDEIVAKKEKDVMAI